MFDQEYQAGYRAAVMEKLAGKAQAAMRAAAGGSGKKLRALRAAAKPAKAAKPGGVAEAQQTLRSLPPDIRGNVRHDWFIRRQRLRDKIRLDTQAGGKAPIPGAKDSTGYRLPLGARTPQEPLKQIGSIPRTAERISLLRAALEGFGKANPTSKGVAALGLGAGLAGLPVGTVAGYHLGHFTGRRGEG